MGDFKGNFNLKSATIQVLEYSPTADVHTAAKICNLIRSIKGTVPTNEEHDPPLPPQQSFIRGESIQTNLLEFTYYIHKTLDQRDSSQVDIIHTAYQKAFDEVGHRRLQGKLFNSKIPIFRGGYNT